MAEKAAILQNYNEELVKFIEHLKIRKEELSNSIKTDESEKNEIETEIQRLSEQLDGVNKRIDDKQKKFSKLESVLGETELRYTQIIDSLGVLLSFTATKGKVEPGS